MKLQFKIRNGDVLDVKKAFVFRLNFDKEYLFYTTETFKDDDMVKVPKSVLSCELPENFLLPAIAFCTKISYNILGGKFRKRQLPVLFYCRRAPAAGALVLWLPEQMSAEARPRGKGFVFSGRRAFFCLRKCGVWGTIPL